MIKGINTGKKEQQKGRGPRVDHIIIKHQTGTVVVGKEMYYANPS